MALTIGLAGIAIALVDWGIDGPDLQLSISRRRIRGIFGAFVDCQSGNYFRRPCTHAALARLHWTNQLWSLSDSRPDLYEHRSCHAKNLGLSAILSRATSAHDFRGICVDVFARVNFLVLF